MYVRDLQMKHMAVAEGYRQLRAATRAQGAPTPAMEVAPTPPPRPQGVTACADSTGQSAGQPQPLDLSYGH